MNLDIDRIYLSAELDEKEEIDFDNANTDVIVYLQNGQRFVASFFTYKNIEFLHRQHQQNGEYLSGKYFWVNGLFIIDVCTRENIQLVVKHLIDEGEFQQVFRKL